MMRAELTHSHAEKARESSADEEENLSELLVFLDSSTPAPLSEAPSSDRAPTPSPKNAPKHHTSSLQTLRRKRERELLQKSDPTLFLSNYRSSQQPITSASSLAAGVKRARCAGPDGNSSSSRCGPQQQQLPSKDTAGEGVAKLSSSPVTTLETSSASFSSASSTAPAASPPLVLAGGGKRWTEKAVEQVLASYTDPIGKFLRDLGVSAADVIRLNIMPRLDEAPRKPRTGYGKRKDMPLDDRQALSRERNREHARSTRQRRKVFETVLDQQLQVLGQAVCSSFTTSATERYLQRRSRRVENLVGLFLLMDSHIAPGASVSWQHCLSSDLSVRLQLQGLLNVDEPHLSLLPENSHHSHGNQLLRQQHPPGAVDMGIGSGSAVFSSPFASLSATEGAGRSESPEKQAVEDSYCFSDSVHHGSLERHQRHARMIGDRASEASSSTGSQGSSLGIPRISLVTDLTPPQMIASPTASSSRFAAAFFGLPPSLLHLPLSPSHIKLVPIPSSCSYRGYESLQTLMKRVLEALQQAVYHVLLTNSFYRKVFDVLVPGTAAGDSWTKSPSWQPTPFQEQRTPQPQHTPALAPLKRLVDLQCEWTKTPSPPAAAAATSEMQLEAGIAAEMKAGERPTQSPSSADPGDTAIPATAVENSRRGNREACPPLSGSMATEHIFFSSPRTADEREHPRRVRKDTLGQDPVAESPHEGGAATAHQSPVLRSGGLLCYPSSLYSTQDSVVSHNDSDGDSDHDDSPGDSMRSSMEVDGGHRGPSSPVTSRQTTDEGIATREESGTALDSALAGSVSSECPRQRLYREQHPPSFALEHLVPVGVKFVISFSKDDLLVQGTRAMCSFDLEVTSRVPCMSDQGEAASAARRSTPQGNVDEKEEEENDEEAEAEAEAEKCTTEETGMKDRSVGRDDCSVGISARIKEASSSASTSAAATTTTTLVKVPGALASFSFEPFDAMKGASKIHEANFDLDVNSAALSFLDHTPILQDYFGGGAEREGEEGIEGSPSSACSGRNSTDSGGKGESAEKDGIHFECEEMSTI